MLWIAVFFIAPLAIMCWKSIESGGYTFDTFSALFSSPLYIKVMSTTTKIACISTLFALVLAYPIAYTLTSGSGRVRRVILMFVLIPYWVDIIVRSFSWLIMLGDHGLINKALMGIGLTSEPIELLYNSFSVVAAMIQILLPLTIVTLFGAMLRIDRTLLAAAKIHGASDWNAFRTIFLPLSLPGIYGAGLLVFVLSLGFYVTPALLGSPRETMISQVIMTEATQILDWDQASGAGFVLLLITTALATVYNHYFSLDRLWGGHNA
jgi:ABC-type spermidine/putrescine transport system permease subunit I